MNKLRAYINNSLNDSLRKRIISGSMWSLLSTILPSILGLVASVLVARILGKQIYGEFGIIRSTMEMFANYAGMVMGLTATKYIAEFRHTDKVRAGRIIGLANVIVFSLGFLISVIVLFKSEYISREILNAPHLVSLLKISIIFLFFSSLIGAQNGILSGLESFRTLASVSIFSGVINFLLTLGLTYQYHLEGAVWALILSRIIQWTFTHYVLKKELLRFDIQIFYNKLKDELPIVWIFSLPSIVGGSITALATWAGSAFLVHQNNGYSEMGIFNAASQWRSYLLLLPSVISQVIIPIISERNSSGDILSIKRTIKMSVVINIAATLPIAVILSLLSRNVMSLYGTGFVEGWLVLVLTLVTTVLFAIIIPFAQYITATGRVWLAVLSNFIWSIGFLTAVFYLIHFGAIGLSLAYCLSYVLHAIVTIFIFYRISNFPIINLK